MRCDTIRRALFCLPCVGFALQRAGWEVYYVGRKLRFLDRKFFILCASRTRRPLFFYILCRRNAHRGEYPSTNPRYHPADYSSHPPHPARITRLTHAFPLPHPPPTDHPKSNSQLTGLERKEKQSLHYDSQRAVSYIVNRAILACTSFSTRCSIRVTAIYIISDGRRELDTQH
ncbi:hypothetical protein C8R44DRAFT_148857 [Mycena epipterygia]|nr:hypothetical protein C8R44DRAFT_148857 [Mycena epipterygia]